MNFLSHKASRRIHFQILCAASVVTLVAGCSTKDSSTATQGYKGVINLEGVRLGLPEESTKGAILTFVADPNVNLHGSTQYLSRVYDKNNGQYCLGYKDGQPGQLRVVYAQTPISKEDALLKLKQILPSGSPEESKVDDTQVKAGKKESPIEYRYFGDALRAELIFADKTAKTVKLVSITNISKVPSKEAAAATPATEKTAATEEKKTD
jgi:hypothetical protein